MMGNLKKIKALHTEISSYMSATLEKACALGRLLHEEKKLIKYGEWDSATLHPLISQCKTQNSSRKM